MYLKVKTSLKTNGWRMFEAHSIQWHKFTMREWEEANATNVQVEGVQYFDFTAPEVSPVEPNGVMLITFFDEDNEAVEIATTKPAYLLNDRGVTLEHIN